MSKGKKAASGKRVTALACTALVFAAAFFAVFIHGGYMNRVLARLGLQRNAVPVDWAIGWERCLRYMDVDADAVFFGDSITSGGDFNALFPDRKICNLGIPGDTLRGMADRAGMIAAVKPEKVFLLGGINSLTDNSYEASLDAYRVLLDRIGEATDAEVGVQGILPVSAKQEKRLHVTNATITRFNEKLREMAEEKGYQYIDLPAVFMKDGEMNPDYTTEGIHLSGDGYHAWADMIAGYL